MLYEICNGKLTAAVSSRGGELTRLSAFGRELLWKGDPAFWEGHSPNLFPVCGRLRGLRYVLDGREYPMPPHGFIKDCELIPSEITRDTLTFLYRPDADAKQYYPFDYRLELSFRLEGQSLLYAISVTNDGGRDMYFAWGGHPGFGLPLDPGHDFEDYNIVFGAPCSPVAMEITPDGYVGPGRTRVQLEDGVKLPLKRSYFEIDGLFMTGTPGALTLEGPGKTKITLEYPDCPTLGLWTSNGGNAPFICVEPWSGTPDRADGPLPCRLESKPDMIKLAPGETYRGHYAVTASIGEKQ